MREIKFRAWDKINKKMYKVEVLCPGKYIQIEKPENNKGNILAPFEGRIWEDVEIMQYTGLLDKNEIEIYEGDILKTNISAKEFAEVIYDDTQTTYYAKYSDESTYPLTEWFKRNNEFEVIGNIYENKELLK